MLLGLALVLTACHRKEVAVYDAPKDSAPPPATPPPAHGGMGSLPGGMPALPGLRWSTLPEGWTSLGPAGMRVGNFSIKGSAGGAAELAVIPLPGSGGGDLDLVNLWRGQLQLPPIPESELSAHTDETTLAGQPVKIFSIVGTNATDAAAGGNQILVVALRREGFTWFFKLSGDALTVDANRDGLKSFLGNVEFTAPEAPPMMASAPASAPPAALSGGGEDSTPAPAWGVPTDWRPAAAPPMVHSKWDVPSAGTGSAEVTVSVFPGAVGGVAANLNRWRAQVGLSPAPESELNALADNLDVLGGKATLADFAGTSPKTGQSVRMVAAIVQRGGQSWFYKLMGDPAAVEAQRSAFLKFVQTVQYSPSA